MKELTRPLTGKESYQEGGEKVDVVLRDSPLVERNAAVDAQSQTDEATETKRRQSYARMHPPVLPRSPRALCCH